MSWDKRAADALADEVAVLVRRKAIDSRSPAADALLDYRDPPFTPRSERLTALENRVESLEKALRECVDAYRGPSGGSSSTARIRTFKAAEMLLKEAP